MKLYHGSDAIFDAFDKRYIGTGDGCAVYGRGFYFTPKLKDAVDYATVALYAVEVPDDDGTNYFPFISQQFVPFAKRITPALQKHGFAVKTIGSDYAEWVKDHEPSISAVCIYGGYASAIYESIADAYDEEFAAQIFRESGYAGIRSGRKGRKDNVYVIFDPSDITIVERHRIDYSPDMNPYILKEYTNHFNTPTL